MRLGTISVDRSVHGPCHRCGWTTDVTRVSRKSARRLGVRPHSSLCDECLTDLRHQAPLAVATGVTVPSVGQPAHQRRHVA